jgi:prophage regulatory protein
MTTTPYELIDWDELQTLVPYSRQHLRRLEAKGKFPHRLNVGENRVAWVRSEVYAWIEERKAQRPRAWTPTVRASAAATGEAS